MPNNGELIYSPGQKSLLLELNGIEESHPIRKTRNTKLVEFFPFKWENEKKMQQMSKKEIRKTDGREIET